LQKETKIHCKGQDCEIEMSKEPFIERTAETMIKKKKSLELIAKVEKLEKTVSYFTQQKITQSEALTYVTKRIKPWQYHKG